MSKRSTQHQPAPDPASGPSAFTANALVWDPEQKEGRVIPITAMVHSPAPVPGTLKISGTMGPVMHTSVVTAVTVAGHAMAEQYGRDLFRHNTILVAIPDFEDFLVEGESAGLAVFTAVTGAMRGWESSPHVAMTGTIDENGNIGRVGATEEKIQMAADNGITMVIIPGSPADPVNLVPDMRLSPRENEVLTIIRVTHASDIATLADV